MFTLFAKKHAVVDLPLDNAVELDALNAVAAVVADRLNLDRQAVKSSLIASEVAGSQIVADRVVVMHATSDQLTRPQSLLITFREAVQWSEASTPVDYALVLVIPDGSDYETVAAPAVAKLVAQKGTLGTLKSNASALNRLNATLL
ncbi:PTS sugar transporter subunit IIA [Lacticaseibacillus parakribbianus]|uniref:PTS sugar transporter subunit IIA n=1 Tax=Lacticaseibacillus parakribbianus TaxID=2970927 RepID=UPI0021CAF28B|nr:PTS sugar transporter subunit IIA [Lacticaseibacillus parakribbianus]